MPTLRVLTFNVLSGAAGREGLVREVVRAIRPDLAVFAEARETKAFEAVLGEVGPHLISGGDHTNRACVVVASRWPIVASERFGPPWASAKWVRATVRPFEWTTA